jgi:Zn-dependent protease
MVMVAQGQTPKHERVVAIAGPLVNLALAIVAAAGYLALGGRPVVGLVLPFGDDMFVELWSSQRVFLLILFDFVQQQMTLFLFNMLCAAYPMDGGRVLLSFLWARRGFHSGLIASCKVSRVIAVALGLVGLATQSFLLVIVAISVFMQAQSTLRRAAEVPDPGRGYDSGFARALRQQAAMREAAKKQRHRPSFLKRWFLENREAKVRQLLARAERDGIASLTPSERAWLQTARARRR